jgi:hypothetical protein
MSPDTGVEPVGAAREGNMTGWGEGRPVGRVVIVLGLLIGATAACGPAALMLVTVAGGAAAVSGEPQRLYGSQGADFNEGRIAEIRSGVHTAEDVIGLLGHPQRKIFTVLGEEWSYRYYLPPSMLRPGMEKVLTVRFRNGKVDDVNYSVSAL